METGVFYEYLAGKAFSRDTRETLCFANLYYLIHTFYTHTIYSNIPTLPTIVEESFWEKTLAKNLES